MPNRALLSVAALAATVSVVQAASHLSVPMPKDALLVQGDHGVPLVLSLHHRPPAAGQPNHYLPKRGIVAGNLSDEPNATYVSWYGYLVCSADVCGQTIRIAAAFTPKSSTQVSGIDVGLMAATSSPDYGYVAKVALYSDSGGVPGKRIDGQDVTAAEATPNACCLTTHAKLKSNPKLKAGTQYWVVVTPDPNAYMVWAYEDLDFITPETFATDGGGGWTSAAGPWEVPSFQVE